MDNEELLRKCFEFDWSNMRFPKMSEETQAKVKEALWSGYKMIKETYRYQAGIGTPGNVFSI